MSAHTDTHIRCRPAGTCRHMQGPRISAAPSGTLLAQVKPPWSQGCPGPTPTSLWKCSLVLPHSALSVHMTMSPLSKQTRTQRPCVCASAQLTYADSLFCIQLYRCGGEQGREGLHYGAARAGDRCIQRSSEGSRHGAAWSPKEEAL